jgi:hypothetical protein
LLARSAADAPDRQPPVLASPRRVSTGILTGKDQHAVQKVDAMVVDVATSLVLIPFELHAALRTTIGNGGRAKP